MSDDRALFRPLLHQGFTLDSLGGVVYSIPDPQLNWTLLLIQSLTSFYLKQMSNDQVPVILTNVIVLFLIINKYSSILNDKILKEDK